MAKDLRSNDRDDALAMLRAPTLGPSLNPAPMSPHDEGDRDLTAPGPPRPAGSAGRDAPESTPAGKSRFSAVDLLYWFG